MERIVPGEDKKRGEINPEGRQIARHIKKVQDTHN